MRKDLIFVVALGSFLLLFMLPVSAEELGGQEIGHGLHEPPGPGWRKSPAGDGLWFNEVENFLVGFIEDPDGSFQTLRDKGFTRTPRGWVDFTPRAVPDKPPRAISTSSPPAPMSSTPAAAAQDAPDPPSLKAIAGGFVMLVSMVALVAIGATASYQILKSDYAKRAKALEEEYAALKALLLKRMKDMIEKPPNLRLVKSAYGERIVVRFGLDPDAGRVRIDWTLKPEQRQPLRVQLFLGPQKLLCSEFAACGHFDGNWPPGEYPLRVRARAADAPEGSADEVTYLLTVPTAAESADMIAKLKDAIARVGRFAGEGRAAVSKTERDLAEQWSREGLDEEEINKLLNTVRGATSRMFEEALTTLKKAK